MTKLSKFVSLSSKVDSIPREYGHLIQVWNSSVQMLQVVRGVYLFERAFALVDASDEITRKLIDENILIIIDAPVRDMEQKDLTEAPQRKSKARISKDNKLKVEELGRLFQND